MTQNNRAVELSQVQFSWQSNQPHLLEIDQLHINRGEQVFIQGASGSGKSTLLNLLGGVAVPQRGRISVLGQPLERLGTAARDRFRADHIGFVFQQFNLIPYLSPVDNVLLPIRFSKRRLQALDGEPPVQQARHLLAALELDAPGVQNQPAHRLSIGQQQRVAVARALIGKPELIIADEPTSSLDADSQARFLDLLFAQCRAQRSTLVFVSHDQRLAPLFQRQLSLAEINRAPTRSSPPSFIEGAPC